MQLPALAVDRIEEGFPCGIDAARWFTALITGSTSSSVLRMRQSANGASTMSR
jgi:hypothetical protein